VLAYAALPDGLAIWAYDNRGVNAQWIPQTNRDLQELAARFYDLTSDSQSEPAALRRDSQSLYRALIAPIAPWLEPGRILVVEAEGWLAQIPFEALLDSEGHFLIERAPIVYSLGRSTDEILREDIPIAPNQPALVVGSTASSQAEGLVPLPDVVAEADTVAKNFQSPTELKASGATLRAVESALRTATVFHYAGHSLTTPQGAALLLASGDPRNAPVLLNADRLRHWGGFRVRQVEGGFCWLEVHGDSFEDPAILIVRHDLVLAHRYPPFLQATSPWLPT